MKIDNPELLGQVMRERRKALGFTIEQMAQAVGVAPITIMRLELGRLGYIHNRTAKLLEVPKKVIKRMVMVPAPVDAEGKVLPTSTLANSPNAEVREMAIKPLSGPHQPVMTEKRTEIVSGDVQDIDPVPAFHKEHRRARNAKLEAKKAKQGGDGGDGQDGDTARHGRAHTASPLKKLFLWMAAKV